MTELGKRINLLIAKRDLGFDVQTEIDALMIQLEALPEAIEARASASAEAAEYAHLYA